MPSCPFLLGVQPQSLLRLGFYQHSQQKGWISWHGTVMLPYQPHPARLAVVPEISHNKSGRAESLHKHREALGGSTPIDCHRKLGISSENRAGNLCFSNREGGRASSRAWQGGAAGILVPVPSLMVSSTYRHSQFTAEV